MTVFDQIIHESSMLVSPKVVHGTVIYQDTAAVVSASTTDLQTEKGLATAHSLNCPRPMKLYLLDQDTGSQEVWHNSAESVGIAFQLFKHNEFLIDLPKEAGILVIDKSVCEQDFVGQVEKLCRRNRRHQVIATGQGLTLDQVVDLMRFGVTSAFQKPLNKTRISALLPAIVQKASDTIKSESEFHHLNSLFSSLTVREKQVLDMVLGGIHNRESAEQLGVSVRTVEARRAKVYRKLECNGLAELVRKIERLDRLKSIFASVPDSVNDISSFGRHHLDRPTAAATTSEGS